MEFKITKENIKTNFYLYKIYLLAATIILSIFVAFLNFTSDQTILVKISESGRVEMMAKSIYFFLLGFLIFFLIYFNHFFLKNRSRDIGILALLGFSKGKLIKILCYESVVILTISYLTSIVLGTMAYFGISKSITCLLNLGIDTTIHIDKYVMVKTLIISLVIFIINTIINTILVMKQSLVEFVHYSKKVEKQFKVHKIMGVIAFFCLAFGYILCLLSYMGTRGIWGFGITPIFGITLLTIIAGTVILVKYGLVYGLHIKKHNKEKLYTPVGNIIYPKLSFRISTKNRLLIVLSALLTLTVTIIGIMTITLVYPIRAVDRLTPSVIEYQSKDSTKEVDNRLDEIAQKYRANILQTHLLSVKTTPNVPIVEDGTKSLDYFDVLKYSEYVKLMKNQGKENLIEKDSDNFALLLNYYPTARPLGMDFSLNGKQKITIKKISTNNIFSFATSVTTLVVDDSLFEVLSKDKENTKMIITTLNGDKLRDDRSLYMEFENIDELQNSYLKKYNIIKDNASTFIFISFITILLVICTTSILYFTNLIEIVENKKEYEYLKKIGYSKKQILQILKKEIGTLYKVPIILGTLNGCFVLFAFRFIFIDNLIGSKDLITTTLISLGTFIGLYFSFYSATKKTAWKLLNI